MVSSVPAEAKAISTCGMRSIFESFLDRDWKGQNPVAVSLLGDYFSQCVHVTHVCIEIYSTACSLGLPIFASQIPCVRQVNTEISYKKITLE